jgi:hypothetical protein
VSEVICSSANFHRGDLKMVALEAPVDSLHIWIDGSRNGQELAEEGKFKVTSVKSTKHSKIQNIESRNLFSNAQ